jgi:asparagine synthase (glutamine-hydrolysing)
VGGLSAIIHFDRSPLDRETLVRMTDAAAHRGPQGTSYALGHHAGLAALTLLPSVSRSGRKPHALATSDVGVDLVADARLDRRDELLRQLSAAGQSLADPGPDDATPAGQVLAGGALAESPSDADLLLASYLAWGEGCPQRLSGDFAFVVWDRRHRRVFCARDRFGVKPLHYFQRGRRLYVASEAQQLLRGLGLRAQLDEVAVADYLMDDSRDEERTFFVGLRRLPPASALVVESGRRRVQGYWRPSESGIPRFEGRELEEETRRLLREAVEERLPSEGPVVGLTMSGGLDSCSVAALVQGWSRVSASRPQLLALTYAFPSLETCDETAYSSAMSSELGVEIEPVDAEKLWLLGSEEDFAPSLEGPFQGWESTDRVFLERLRQRGGRVLLTGFGGDNLFAGSRQVYLSRLRRGRLSAVSDVVRRARALDISVARAIYYFLMAPVFPGFDAGLRRWLGRPSLASPPRWIEPRFAERVGLSQRLTRSGGERLFRDPAREAHWRAIRCLESVGRACYWLDRTAARHGVEVRHPFLDHELAELLLAADPEEHQGAGGSKLLLRRAMSGELPEAVRQRQDKTRFAAFIEHSLRREQARIDQLLQRPLVAELGFVDGARLRRAWRSYLAGRAGYMLRHLWYVLTLELWLQRFYEPSASALLPVPTGQVEVVRDGPLDEEG